MILIKKNGSWRKPTSTLMLQGKTDVPGGRCMRDGGPAGFVNTEEFSNESARDIRVFSSG